MIHRIGNRLIPLHAWFTWRYFKSKKSLQAITIIARITTISIAIGTAALVIVLSIFNGFEGLVKELYASFYPDICVTHQQTPFFQIDTEKINTLRQTQGVSNLSLTIESNGILQYADNRANVLLKGVDTNYNSVTGLAQKINKGSYETGTSGQPFLIVGYGIEQSLGLQTDRNLIPVTAYLPKINAPATGNPLDAISTFSMMPSGSFIIQQEFDTRYAITNLFAMQHFLGVNANTFSNIEIKLSSGANEKKVVETLKKILGSNFNIANRYEQNRTLYGILQSEKWAIFAILSFILILASFNMIGTITLLIFEKQKDVQVIKALGGDDSFIKKVFLGESLLLGLVGGLSGIGLGMVFCFLQQEFHLIALEGSFVIDYYPVKMIWWDIAIIFLTIVVIALAAGMYPAIKASKKTFSLKAQ
jgi:lipoprotein-releasing system permease protein